MKYNVKGIIWPLGYKVEVNQIFNTYEEAEEYCKNKIKYMCGEQFIITIIML